MDKSSIRWNVVAVVVVVIVLETSSMRRRFPAIRWNLWREFPSHAEIILTLDADTAELISRETILSSTKTQLSIDSIRLRRMTWKRLFFSLQRNWNRNWKKRVFHRRVSVCWATSLHLKTFFFPPLSWHDEQLMDVLSLQIFYLLFIDSFISNHLKFLRLLPFQSLWLDDSPIAGGRTSLRFASSNTTISWWQWWWYVQINSTASSASSCWFPNRHKKEFRPTDFSWRHDQSFSSLAALVSTPRTDRRPTCARRTPGKKFALCATTTWNDFERSSSGNQPFAGGESR